MTGKRTETLVHGATSGLGSDRRVLSSAIVRCITGPIDDQSVVDIIRSGASERQLFRAVEQLNDTLGSAPRLRPFDSTTSHPVTLKLVRILARSQARSYAAVASPAGSNGRKEQR